VSVQPTTEQDDDAMRRRIAALEAEQAERLATAHAALAAAQDRLYWLDRWGVDLNVLMRRRGAVQLRLALRAIRSLLRTAIRAKRGAQKLPQQWRRARSRAELDG
jgi:hypothetical protein